MKTYWFWREHVNMLKPKTCADLADKQAISLLLVKEDAQVETTRRRAPNLRCRGCGYIHGSLANRFRMVKRLAWMRSSALLLGAGFLPATVFMYLNCVWLGISLQPLAKPGWCQILLQYSCLLWLRGATENAISIQRSPPSLNAKFLN